MTEPTPSSLAAAVERLVASTPAIRAGIRRHSVACWAEHLSIVTHRFHSNANWATLDVRALRDAVDPLIRYAAECDALECLRVLHDGHCSFFHVKRPNGTSLLHDAARRGSVRTLAWLIDAQCLPVDAKGKRSETSLHVACSRGHMKVVRALLARRAFIDAPDCIGETPLHLAARAGWNEIVQVLIDAGANLGATSRYGETALSLAVYQALQSSAWKAVGLLLDHGAALTQALPTLLRCAPDEITQHPRFQAARIETCDQEPLCRLFETASPDQARTLLQRGADPARAATYALRNSSYALLAVIRAHHPFRYTSAHYHVALQSVHGLEQLLDQGGDPNTIIEGKYSDERYPLIYVTARGYGYDISTIPVLLRRGARPVAPPELLAQPLIIELVRRHGCASPEVVSMYAKCGHDIDARANGGQTALHELAAKVWTDHTASSFRALRCAGTDIEARDADGLTPLMHCVRAYSAVSQSGLAALLEAGACVNVADKRGLTVLHHLFDALRQEGPRPDYHTAFQLLVSHGADIDARCPEGLYPEEMGNEVIHADLRESLRRLRGRARLSRPEIPDGASRVGNGSTPAEQSTTHPQPLPGSRSARPRQWWLRPPR